MRHCLFLIFEFIDCLEILESLEIYISFYDDKTLIFDGMKRYRSRY